MFWFWVCYFILLLGAGFFVFCEHGAYSEIKDRYESLRHQNSDLLKKYLALQSDLEKIRPEFNSLKAELEDTQLHCAKLREQQQVLEKKQKILDDRTTPIKVEVILPKKKKTIDSKPTDSNSSKMKEFSKKVKKVAKLARQENLV